MASLEIFMPVAVKIKDLDPHHHANHGDDANFKFIRAI